MVKKPSVTTNAKHWCEYCRLYVYNNTISRNKHDNSPQHKAAVTRYVERVQREECEQERLLKDLQTRTGVVLETRAKGSGRETVSFYGAGGAARKAPPVHLLSMKGPVASADRERKRPKAASTATVLGAAPASQRLAQAAVVGQWQPSEPKALCEKTVQDDGDIDGDSDSDSDSDVGYGDSRSESQDATYNEEIPAEEQVHRHQNEPRDGNEFIKSATSGASANAPPRAPSHAPSHAPPHAPPTDSTKDKTPASEPIKFELRKFSKPTNLRGR